MSDVQPQGLEGREGAREKAPPNKNAQEAIIAIIGSSIVNPSGKDQWAERNGGKYIVIDPEAVRAVREAAMKKIRAMSSGEFRALPLIAGLQESAQASFEQQFLLLKEEAKAELSEEDTEQAIRTRFKSGETVVIQRSDATIERRGWTFDRVEDGKVWAQNEELGLIRHQPIREFLQLNPLDKREGNGSSIDFSAMNSFNALFQSLKDAETFHLQLNGASAADIIDSIEVYRRARKERRAIPSDLIPNIGNLRERVEDLAMAEDTANRLRNSA